MGRVQTTNVQASGSSGRAARVVALVLLALALLGGGVWLFMGGESAQPQLGQAPSGPRETPRQPEPARNTPILEPEYADPIPKVPAATEISVAELLKQYIAAVDAVPGERPDVELAARLREALIARGDEAFKAAYVRFCEIRDDQRQVKFAPGVLGKLAELAAMESTGAPVEAELARLRKRWTWANLSEEKRKEIEAAKGNERLIERVHESAREADSYAVVIASARRGQNELPTSVDAFVKAFARGEHQEEYPHVWLSTLFVHVPPTPPALRENRSLAERIIEEPRFSPRLKHQLRRAYAAIPSSFLELLDVIRDSKGSQGTEAFERFAASRSWTASELAGVVSALTSRFGDIPAANATRIAFSRPPFARQFLAQDWRLTLTELVEAFCELPAWSGEAFAMGASVAGLISGLCWELRSELDASTVGALVHGLSLDATLHILGYATSGTPDDLGPIRRDHHAFDVQMILAASDIDLSQKALAMLSLGKLANSAHGYRELRLAVLNAHGESGLSSSANYRSYAVWLACRPTVRHWENGLAALETATATKRAQVEGLALATRVVSDCFDLAELLRLSGTSSPFSEEEKSCIERLSRAVVLAIEYLNRESGSTGRVSGTYGSTDFREPLRVGERARTVLASLFQ